jgi:hypothetical protein
MYLRGHVTISTGERCLITDWLLLVRPDPELDLLGIGDPDLWKADEEPEDDALLWVDAATLLLSSLKRSEKSLPP